jgi:hypothetical protein
MKRVNSDEKSEYEKSEFWWKEWIWRVNSDEKSEYEKSEFW